VSYKTLLITVVISVFTATVGLAGDNYKCTIAGLLHANNGGNRATTDKEQYIGTMFTVERSTGLMIGSINNKSKTQPTILDIGSNESFYRVSNTIENESTSYTCTLIIEEPNKEEQKPFVFMIDIGTYYGTCIHF